MPGFEEWESFYVIVGTAAAALIGLQFVVLALIADRPQLASREGGAAFASPTVVHFSAVLLLSAVLRVPWEESSHAIILWGLIGFAGVVYLVVVSRRMRRQRALPAPGPLAETHPGQSPSRPASHLAATPSHGA